MQDIKKVAVIGAGTMGSGIASHLANAGIQVYLLDVPNSNQPSSITDQNTRNHLAEQAVQRQLQSQPPAFFHPDRAKNITVGNIEDDLHGVADVDWVVEAIVERLEIKKSVYAAIDEHRAPGTPISSNTSTIPLSLLTQNMPDSFKQDFCITHFFNPVRFMRLLEIVSGPMTRPEVISKLTNFCDLTLGKGVVACKDTPGFLGNRVGVYAIQVGIIEAIRARLTVEESDLIMGRVIGWPKTGVFRLYDLIGLDLMLDVLKSMRAVVPTSDPFYDATNELPIIRRLTDSGHTGDKGLGGFYRRNPETGGAESVDLQTGEYRSATKVELAAVNAGMTGGLRSLVEYPDKYGQYAWRVLSQSLSYAATLVPEVSDELLPIDEAMKLGFNWIRGPFEMIDQLGVDWFVERLTADGIAVPPILASAKSNRHSTPETATSKSIATTPTTLYRALDGRLQHRTIDGEYQNVERPDGVTRLADRIMTSSPVIENVAASLWDLGDGVACFEFHTKANAIVPETMTLLEEAIEVVARDYKAMIVHNDGPHFSMGVNIQNVLDNARNGAWSSIEKMLVDFQRTCKKLKYADFPVIGAPGGMSLGGGFEVLLHCDALVAHTNTVTGLVESLVGLIPSGGGCKEMLLRWSSRAESSIDLVKHVYRLIGPAKTASSPELAESFLFLLPHDETIMNRDRILARAKTKALDLTSTYQPPIETTISAAGLDGMTAIDEIMESWDRKGILAPHDFVVGAELGKVLCGGNAATGSNITEDHLYDLERASFMTLVKTPSTLARIEHTLTQGKPLRN